MKYDRKAIDRSFKFHTSDAISANYLYHGYDREADVYRVMLQGERFELKPREAYLVAFALAAARETGKRAALQARKEKEAARRREALAER